jgi:hypothetical protein
MALSWLKRLLKQSRQLSRPSRKRVWQNRFVPNLEANRRRYDKTRHETLLKLWDNLSITHKSGGRGDGIGIHPQSRQIVTLILDTPGAGLPP